MWNPKDEAKKAAKKAVDKIVEPAAERVVDTVIKPAEEAAGKAIWEARSKAWHRITDTGKAQVERIEKAGDALEDRLPDLIAKELPAALKRIAEEGYAAATSPVADAIVDTLQLAAPSSAGIGVSVLDLSFDDLTGRVDALQEWVKHPPDVTDWGKLRPVIERLAPSSITVNVSVRAAFLVASTNATELRGQFTWDLADFLDKGEVVCRTLKKALS